MSDLPAGWERTNLGSLVELKYGKGLPDKLRRPGCFKVFGSNGQVGVHERAVTAGPTLIIGRKGSIGELHKSNEPCFPIDTTYFIDDFAATSIDFVEWLLRFLPLRNLNRATAIPGLNREDAYELSISLPPLAEQRRIVAKLDALTARTARARADLDRVPALVARYRQAVLRAAFQGVLTAEWRQKSSDRNAVAGRRVSEIKPKYRDGLAAPFTAPYGLPEGWAWMTLPELGELDRGKSKHRPRDDERLFGGAFPFIQTGEVRAADRYLDTYSKTYSEFGLAQSRLWEPGAVCITIAANIAETAILRISTCFPDSVVGFVADERRTTPEYIEYFLRTARGDLEQFAPATAQKNINLDTLACLRAPLPPLAEQIEIVRRVDAAFSEIDRLTAEAAAARRLIDRLDQAILAKAFLGKLVPQDSAEEPASELLERIRSDRAGAAKARRHRAQAA